MPTIDHLQAAFTELENQAPANCDAAILVRQNTPRISRRVLIRRWMLPVLAGATVVGAVAIPIAVRLHSPGSSAHPVASPPTTSAHKPTAAPPTIPPVSLTALTYVFSVRPIAGVTISDSRAGRDYQQIEVDSTAADRIPVAWVLAYPAGGFHPARPAGAVDVRVGGHIGFSGIISSLGPGMTATSDGPGLQAVAWQYSPGAWAIVQSGILGPVAPAALTALRVAGAVDFRSPHLTRVPVKIGYLPGGLTPDSIRSSVQGPGQSTVIDFASSQPHRLGMTIEIGTDAGAGFGPATHRGTPITIDGFTGYYDSACGSIYLIGSGVYVAITSTDHLDGDCHAASGLPLPSQTTLTKVLRGLTFASHPTDPSTWFNAASAIPTR